VDEEVNQDKTGEADENNESGSWFQRRGDAYLNERSVIFKEVGEKEWRQMRSGSARYVVEER